MDYTRNYGIKGKIKSNSTWDTLVIDVMSHLLRGSKEEKFVVLVIDCFSRYIIPIPSQDRTAETVSYILYECVVCYFRVPTKLFSGGGTKFTGKIGKELLET